MKLIILWKKDFAQTVARNKKNILNLGAMEKLRCLGIDVTVR